MYWPRWRPKIWRATCFLAETHRGVLSVLRMAEALSPRYAVVVANPPYMGGKGMNGRLSAWAKENYPNSKSDLFAMFMERNLDLAVQGGAVAMITMQSWMFLSSFEALRSRILEQHTILSMAHLGARAFDSIGGEVVSTTAFVLENTHKPDYRGAYLRLVDGNSEAEKMEMMVKAIAQGGAMIKHLQLKNFTPSPSWTSTSRLASTSSLARTAPAKPSCLRQYSGAERARCSRKAGR
jgi:hypothetical protein